MDFSSIEIPNVQDINNWRSYVDISRLTKIANKNSILTILFIITRVAMIESIANFLRINYAAPWTCIIAWLYNIINIFNKSIN